MRKNIQIPGLDPNATYAIQLRGVDDEGNFGLWSTRLQFDTVKDEIAPAPVTNLAVEVDGADFVITWDSPTTDANGDTLDDLRDFIVTISEPVGVTPKQYVTVDNTFDFTYNMNVAQFGANGAPSIEVDVKARDRVGNLSTAATTTSTNAAPTAPTLAAVAKRNAVELSWNDTFEDDGRRFEIWKNSAKYAEVGPATLTWTDNDVGDGAQNYMVRAVDRFEQSTDSNTVTESEVELDPADTLAPSAPTNAGYTDEAEGLTATATLSWSAPTTDEDATSYTDQEGFDVRYRENAAGRPWNYEKVVDDRADGTTAQTFELEVEVDAGITLDWEVRAFDRSGNASGWLTSQNAVSQDTTPPSTPAAPTAVGNTQSIQVSHDLTDNTAATLGDNVVRLDIYVGTSSDFVSMTKEASVDINRPSLGIDAVTTIPYPVPDTDTGRFVRVVAISSAGIESTESAAASVTVGLVQNANIADATITNAKIDNVAANKLTAGSAFINDLSVESKLTINTGGTLESSNFDATARTGWAVDDGNLYLFDGEIDASLIVIQQGANLIDNAYANFLNDPDWYTDKVYTVGGGTLSISSTIWSRYGSQALRWQAASMNRALLGADATDYNIPIESGVSYIISAYVYNNAGAAKRVRVLAEQNDSGTYSGFNSSINPGEYSRVTMVITAGANDTEMQVGFESVDDAADFLIDGVQVEQQVGDLEDPSFFKVGGITTIGGGQVTTGTLDATLVDVVNLDADNILFGTLSGDRIDANAISIRELRVKGDNMFPDPSFEFQATDLNVDDGIVLGGAVGGASLSYRQAGTSKEYVRSGAWSLAVENTEAGGNASSDFFTLYMMGLEGGPISPARGVPAQPGETFYFRAYVGRDGNDPTATGDYVSATITFYDEDGTAIISASPVTIRPPDVSTTGSETWGLLEGFVTAPDDAVTAFLSVTFDSSITSTSGGGGPLHILFDDLLFRRGVSASFIGDVAVGDNIRSVNYSPGAAGWLIDGDGSAEFNNAVIRGDFEVGTDVILEIDEQSPVGSDVIGVIGWRDNGDYSGEGDAGRIYTGNTRTDANYPEGAARSLYIESPYQTTGGAGTRPFLELSYRGNEILAESDGMQIKTRMGEASLQNTQMLLADHGSGSFRPQYSFIGDTDTGMYRHSENRVGLVEHVSIGSTNIMHLETFDSTGGNKLIVRTATNPPTDEPIFEVQSAGGATRFRVDHGGRVHVGGKMRLATVEATDFGSASNPTFSFDGSTTGFYNNGGALTTTMSGQSVLHMDTGQVVGLGDNTKNLGNSSNRWKSVWAADGTINTSDMEQKQDFSDSDLGLEFIKNLRARKWRWQGGTRPHYGMFAQEVKQTLTDMGITDFAGYIDPSVTFTKDEHTEGTFEQPGYLGLRYHEFIGPLIKAVQELSAEVESLKTQTA